MPMPPPFGHDTTTAFEYRGWSLFEAMDALIAFDQGATDAGVNDGSMQEAVRKHLEELDDIEFRTTCAEFARRYYLSEEAVSQGYGLKNVKTFIDWLGDLGIDV